ncbi:MAG: hypothetical protein JXQ89_23165 [Pelagimonas sp.]
MVEANVVKVSSGYFGVLRMKTFFEVDWANASVAERRGPTKALYKVLRELAKHLGMRFDDLVVEAQGSPISETEDPHRNFRRGEIAW